MRLTASERAELHFSVHAGPVVFPAGIAKVQWSKRARLGLAALLLLPLASCGSMAPVVQCVPDSIYLPCEKGK